MLAVLALGAWTPGHGRLADGALIGAGGLVIVGFQTMQFSVLARVFAETQRLLPPMRQRVSSLLDRVTLEVGLLTGFLLCALALAGSVESIVLSRSSDPHAQAASPAFRLGACSVLSGFVPAWSARPTDTATRVWQRRAARILPTYLVTWLVAGAAASWLIGETPWRAGAANLLLVQAWIPRESIYFGWNGPAWSLSCEAFFYLLLPLILPRVARLSARDRLRLASALVAVDICLTVVASIATPRETSV